MRPARMGDDQVDALRLEQRAAGVVYAAGGLARARAYAANGHFERPMADVDRDARAHGRTMSARRSARSPPIASPMLRQDGGGVAVGAQLGQRW
jgi:hypothetical protein